MFASKFTFIPLSKILAVIGWVGCLAAFSTAFAQESDQEDEAKKPPPAKETVMLTTADGVMIGATYYRAVDANRDTPVVVLLPDSGDSRDEFDKVAESMQDPADDEATAFALLSVDLRGQGESVKRRMPDGSEQKMRGGRKTPAMYGAMAQQDLEAVRQFLVEKNDAGELNLNRLAYFGVGMGAVVATNGAAIDWSVRDLNAGKQGKDVKALLLVSPPWKYRGLGVLDALRQPGVQSEVAVMLMYGAGSSSASADADRILKQLERGRPSEPEPTEDTLPSVFKVAGETKLQGNAWLKRGGKKIEELIRRFLEQHVVSPNYGWSQRRLN